jgi:hypothetical protein
MENLANDQSEVVDIGVKHAKASSLLDMIALSHTRWFGVSAFFIVI